MARCHCLWRRVLLCVCVPCILFAMLFTYVVLMVCFGMATITSTSSDASSSGSSSASFASLVMFEEPHFIASGNFRNEGYAPIPCQPFWNLHLQGDALWNQLQLHTDRQYNPILRPNLVMETRKRGKNFVKSKLETNWESLSTLRTAFSEIKNQESQMKDFEKLPSQMTDFVRSMHQRQYPVLIKPSVSCGAEAVVGQQAPLLLLAIKSQEEHFVNRQVIRQTWGREGWVMGEQGQGGFVRRVFLLGRNQEETALLPLLELEAQHYQDILQWDFQDSFFNLTLKDLLFWDWLSQVCPRTHFVFKGDDDVLVRTPALLDYLHQQLKQARGSKGLRSFMVGDVIGAAKPIRDKSLKYFIPKSFYKGLYPTYAGGGGVIYSGALAKRLKLVSRRVHLFPIDDVYVGMCLQRLNVGPIHHPAFLTFDFSKKEAKEPCRYHSILVVHKRIPAELTKIWRDLKETRSQCSNVTLREEE